jgi:hypothetical protein
MKHNVGSYDGAVRALAGFAILFIGHHQHSWWALAGLLPILSSVCGWCPLYALLQLDTSGQDRREAP